MSRAHGKEFTDVWEALGSSAPEAENLRARSELMRQIGKIIHAKGWTQSEAARRCGVSQPRINDLLRGRIARFSLDALVNVAAALGRRVRVVVRAA